MSKPTNELIFEVLKKMQGELGSICHAQTDHGQQFISLREQMLTGNRTTQAHTHDLQNDLLRLEKSLTAIANDVDRIKPRLDLVDAE